MTDGVELGEYEAKRARRMQLNQQMLLSLAIPKIPRRVSRPTPPRNAAAINAGPPRRSERQRIKQRYRKAAVVEREQRRLTRQTSKRAQEAAREEKRLARQKRELQRNLERVKKERQSQWSVERAERERQLQWSLEGAEIERQRQLERPKGEPPSPLDLPFVNPAETASVFRGEKQHLSSSLLDIDLVAFHVRWLGKQLLPAGKQTVMQGLCPPGYVARFSNMSGVQPWKNAVAFFVNVESDSPYDNIFRQEEVDGRKVVHFQWFGQSRWQDASPPMVLRLRQTQRGDERLRFDESYHEQVDKERRQEPLLLFLRHTLGPYIYCGRLGYLGHRPSSKPLEFRWQLLDLQPSDWEQIQGLLGFTVAPSNNASAIKVEDGALKVSAMDEENGAIGK